MKLIEEIISMREAELRDYITDFLAEQGVPFIRTKDYIVTTQFTDKLVPLVCVHTDVVSSNPPMPEMIFEEDGILTTMKPYGCLGADDRAGVWIALRMILEGPCTDFEYGFFVAEEVGALGSTAFSTQENLARFSCFIGLDRACRMGKQQVALYGYDNDELTKLFTDFGYEEAFGSFTDCSNLSSNTFSNKRACVNLSVGYQNEHSVREFLDVNAMEETLDVMLAVIIPEKIYDFEYVVPTYRNWGNFGYSRSYKRQNIWEGFDEWGEEQLLLEQQFAEEGFDGDPIVCEFCDQHEKLYEYQGSQICKGCLKLVSKGLL